MSQVLTIMRKEVKEILANRASAGMGLATSIFFALVYGVALVPKGGTVALDAAIFVIAPMLGVFMSYSFDAQVFLREKMDKVTETLLCAPVSLRQILLGKVLAVGAVAGAVSLIATLVMIAVAGVRAGELLLPSVPIILYLIIVMPSFIVAFAGLYGLGQLALGLRENRFLGLFIFIPLFAALSFVPSLLDSGLAVTWLAVGLVMAGAILLLALAIFLSRFVSRERIVTTLT